MEMISYHKKYLKEALFQNTALPSLQGQIRWRCPSNIALVKYWGKRDVQIPMNTSLSFTLSESYSTSKIEYRTGLAKPEIRFFLDGTRKNDFEERINLFLKIIEGYFPFLAHSSIDIYSSNSFPHSSGIASSASGMGALALVICDIENQLKGSAAETSEFFVKASYIARLGSGSACRSVFSKAALWGKHESVSFSSDEIAIPIEKALHPIFNDYQDIILLIDEGKKSVSSSIGHKLMEGHPYAEQRFLSANKNTTKMLSILEQGDQIGFCELVEHEALSLHAMMMTSTPSFLLIKPSTLLVIEKIRAFRRDTGVQICFTLDAGANIHLLSPGENKTEVLSFVESDLKALCQSGKYIVDKLGNGPQRLETN